MGILGYIITSAISSMFIGIVLTIIGMACFFLLIKGWYKNRTFSIASFAVGAVLFFFICVQNILLCGAVHIKGMTSSLQESLETYVLPLVGRGDQLMSQDEVSNLFFNGLADEFPLLNCYIGYADFQGWRASEIPKVVTDTLNSYLNWYIARRVGWSLLFIVVGAVVVIKTMERAYAKRVSTHNASHHSDRRERLSSRTRRR